MEAMRCLKRQLFDVVYRQALADTLAPIKAAWEDNRDDTSIQRGLLTPRHRHFGSVTSRPRHQQAQNPSLAMH